MTLKMDHVIMKQSIVAIRGAVTFFLKTENFLRIFQKFWKYFSNSENISEILKIFQKFWKYFRNSEKFSEKQNMRFSCSELLVTDVRRARTWFSGGNMPFWRSLTLFIIVSAGPSRYNWADSAIISRTQNKTCRLSPTDRRVAGRPLQNTNLMKQPHHVWPRIRWIFVFFWVWWFPTRSFWWANWR